jgi:GTPase SAR1 family protein
VTKGAILGDSEVGKTSVMDRFCKNLFNPTYLTTIGLDFKIKIMEKQQMKIKLQMWDIASH